MKIKICLSTIMTLLALICFGLVGAGPEASVQSTYLETDEGDIPVPTNLRIVDTTIITNATMLELANGQKLSYRDKAYYVQIGSGTYNRNWSREASNALFKPPGYKL